LGLFFRLNRPFIGAFLFKGIAIMLTTVAGTTISISAGTPATFDSTGYAALTWTVIGNITDGGSHGRVYAPVTSSPIDTRSIKKFKGSYDEGNKDLSIDYDSEDAGMVLLKTALNDDEDYSFKVEYPDGDIDYMQAKVMSLSKATAGVDTMRSVSTSLAITTNSAGVGIVEVLAA
jgi:hypothetical protein